MNVKAVDNNAWLPSTAIKFLSTAFDPDGLDFLNELGIDLMKIPSGEITNFQYLHKIVNHFH